MNILIIGNGGREHALAWKIRQSPRCSKLFVAPGNPGTAQVAENVPIATDDFSSLGEFCLAQSISLLVVGPEAPLVKGIRDYFEQDPKLQHILIVGPGKVGAQLEGSKDFSKQFMVRNGIPTAKARTFMAAELDQAMDYISTCKPPIVLKADGLAAGKGVIISLSQTEAKAVIKDMLVNKKFGEASAKVLIEEFLNGIEVSVFVLTDGKDYVILPEAKDYKRIGDGDTGPNTGGMGAVSPVVFATPAFMKRVEDEVVKPTIAGLQKDGIDYKGFIFVGIMNVGGTPYVIEYNARMGDPETQAVMPRIKSDLVDLLEAVGKGALQGKTIEIDPDHSVTIALVSGGYPGEYEKGKAIDGLGNYEPTLVFHAGTKQQQDKVVTEGGRVLAVSGKGSSLEDARAKAYAVADQIQWDGLYFRKDIGQDLLNFKI
ncbi:phosphoribosylamine--glycine ligase [Parachryseolinea silvisoli]|jgi:phosphoribosylamine--glycine ligase|uniref:phosphoribosylamine--glycine ligase n=1 Tax=Parachryseolinea silvisoli TaxID=2873601 RepID=UPI002265A724|nr:phosphoribosylamine--glycine ligase [Parachryseolinea silvisoli]MCD9016878.1 phosphoribosylamine--glycine ligase [Parachryseolinea silvisoli]